MTGKTTSVVFSRKHVFSCSDMDSIAISCRGPVENNYCGAGFEQSPATLRLRAHIIKGWYALEGENLLEVVDPSKIWFEPEIEKQRFWKLFVRANCNQNWEREKIDVLARAIIRTEARFKSDGSQESMLAAFCEVARQQESALMYWPLGSKFWSICYLFSNEIGGHIKRIEPLAHAQGMRMIEVAEKDLPVH